MKDRRQDAHQDYRVERQAPVETNGATAAHRAGAQRPQRRPQHPRCHNRVGVHENEHFARCRPRPRIARRRNLSAVDADHTGAVFQGDGFGAVGRGVVGHDDFVGFAQRPGRLVQRRQGAAYQRFLVVGRDDERDHEGNPCGRGGGVFVAAAVRLKRGIEANHRGPSRHTRPWRYSLIIKIVCC